MDQVEYKVDKVNTNFGSDHHYIRLVNPLGGPVPEIRLFPGTYTHKLEMVRIDLGDGVFELSLDDEKNKGGTHIDYPVEFNVEFDTYPHL